MRKIISLILLISTLVFCTVSCTPNGQNNNSTENASNPNNNNSGNTNNTVDTGKKVLLVSIDGLRSDAFLESQYANTIIEQSTHYLGATTIYPSYTLPCHMSMHHGVSAESHGVYSNTYTPAENLVDGIAETAAKAGKSCAYFYNWGPLGDVINDDALVKREYIAGETLGWPQSNTDLALACKDYLLENDTDFTFLYLGNLDDAGHNYGWLSEAYYDALDSSLKLVLDILEILSNKYTIIITADHGGHDYTHGTSMPEDMTIPIFIIGEDFEKNKECDGGSILDIAPTIADILGVSPQEAWEGESLK